MTHIDVAGVTAQKIIAFGKQYVHKEDDEKGIQIGQIENREDQEKSQHYSQNDTIHRDLQKRAHLTR